MASSNPHILGRWRIIEMEQWDADYFDMEVEAFIEFGDDGHGGFQFGLVQGEIDYDFDEDGTVEWTWQGVDETEPVSGRGKAAIRSNGKLRGRFVFHGGDSSMFTAERAKTKDASPKARAVDAKTGDDQR